VEWPFSDIEPLIPRLRLIVALDSSPALDGDKLSAVSLKHWLDHVSLQTISIPYHCSIEDRS